MSEEHLSYGEKKVQREQEKEAQRMSSKIHHRKHKLKGWIWWLVGGVFVIGLIWLMVHFGGGDDAVPATVLNPHSIQSNDWIKGEKSAPVTLVEYSDLQCPACRAYFPLLKQLNDAFPEKLRIVYRHFPLVSIHQNAQAAAQAAEAAGAQGKFWEYHDHLFDHQDDWNGIRRPNGKFIEYAEELGLDVDAFEEDLDNKDLTRKINRDRAAGNQLQLGGTPSFFLQGKRIKNPQSIEDFEALIQKEIDALPLSVLESKETHEHADLRVVLDGEVVNLSLEKYQTTEHHHLDEFEHVHDDVGHIVHKHRTGATLGRFFSSLGMDLKKECFVYQKTDYCSDGDFVLGLYVNGELNDQFGDYEFADSDQILVYYGLENGVQTQLDELTDEACIYSETCPERGSAPTESCVGGLGTFCE